MNSKLSLGNVLGTFIHTTHLPFRHSFTLRPKKYTSPLPVSYFYSHCVCITTRHYYLCYVTVAPNPHVLPALFHRLILSSWTFGSVALLGSSGRRLAGRFVFSLSLAGLISIQIQSYSITFLIRARAHYHASSCLCLLFGGGVI